MISFVQLSGPARLRHQRLLRGFRARWNAHYGVWVRGDTLFRMVERLHRAGLVVATISKYGWLVGRRYRELQIFATRADALESGKPIMDGGPR